MQGSEGYASELLVRFQCHWNTFKIAVAQVVRPYPAPDVQVYALASARLHVHPGFGE